MDKILRLPNSNDLKIFQLVIQPAFLLPSFIATFPAKSPVNKGVTEVEETFSIRSKRSVKVFLARVSACTSPNIGFSIGIVFRVEW